MKENHRRRDSENGEGSNDHQNIKPLVFSYHSGEKERRHYSFLCGLS